MIDKINIIKRMFPKLILKNHKIDKNKNKIFILYSNVSKLNWILFRNIIVRAGVHFKLQPMVFVTDSIGFEEISSELDFNPYNPTFNILTKTDFNISNQLFVHTDIKPIKYSPWWQLMNWEARHNFNLFLFTDNKQELKTIVSWTKNHKANVVLFNLYTKKDEALNLKLDFDDKIYSDVEIWNIKYREKVLEKWKETDVQDVIKLRIPFRKNKGVRAIRNKMFTIMNEYYKNAIIPSYYDYEDVFNKDKEDSEEKDIAMFYE